MQLDELSSTPLYKQVFNHYREGIESGLYPINSKLPSIRGLANELLCSRNTIEAAYRLLVQEGYVASRPGSGYTVKDVGLLHANPSSLQLHTNAAPPPIKARYDFTYGNLQTGTFPAINWRTITDDILLSVTSGYADIYTNPLGELDLRHEIARRLQASRGIPCSAAQIVIQGGTQTSAQNLLALFDHRNDPIAMEEPGYDGIRKAFIRSGFSVVPCSVLNGTDAFMGAIERSHARLAFVTPSSQFPTTKVMPLETRRNLLEWAKRTDAYILEDDYCRDFRYRERPAPPLASMDTTGRVIYMGTFSKSLSPALRLSYLVLPHNLTQQWKEEFDQSYSAAPWLSQAVLARFMTSGQWDHHLRRLQAANRAKYDVLIEALRTHMQGRINMRESGTGLHLLVDVLDGRSQEDLIQRAATYGVRVYPTKPYCMCNEPTMHSCILIGFSSIHLEDIEPGIKALADAWFPKKLM